MVTNNKQKKNSLVVANPDKYISYLKWEIERCKFN